MITDVPHAAIDEGAERRLVALVYLLLSGKGMWLETEQGERGMMWPEPGWSRRRKFFLLFCRRQNCKVATQRSSTMSASALTSDIAYTVRVEHVRASIAHPRKTPRRKCRVAYPELSAPHGVSDDE
jgi:hypothetical protein